MSLNHPDETSSSSVQPLVPPAVDVTLDSVSAEDDPRVVAAVKRYMSLLESGDAPSVEDYCLEYPALATHLAPCIAGLAMVQHGFAKAKSAWAASPLETSANSDPAIPEALGDFRIVKELGRGGMGIVYEAVQLSLGRRVALKVLSFAGGLDAVRLQRFRNEAQAAAQLHHTHIVPVYAVGSERGVHYYAMQLIEGQSLSEVIESMKSSRHLVAPDVRNGSGSSANASKGNPKSNANGSGKQSNTLDAMDFDSTQPSNRASRIRYYKSLARMVLQAARALAHAHQYGVVHRDIKPANLLLDPAGNIWITDFGLAQMQSDSNLTRTGDMLGTLRYMSPEQSSGGLTPVDYRTDIYSLGVTFYELLTLRPAVIGSGYHEITNQIANLDPPLPRSIQPLVPAELEIIAQKAISKSPSERYINADEMANDLQRWLDDEPILAKPPSLLHRMAKWRRRHSSLVALGIGFSILAAIGLAITTVAVLSEQSKTADALVRERNHRTASEISFQQARRAVDTFYELSETELANRPDLMTLRREFLEVSLDFYRDFIELRGDDVSLKEQLSATKSRVEELIAALKRLDRHGPLKLLQYSLVQQELSLPAEDATEIQEMITKLEELEVVASSQDPESLQADEIGDGYDWIAEQLSEPQWKRLREIDRQSRLPFTFKSPEVTDALKLTMDQRKTIGLIIEQERPDLATRRMRPMDSSPGMRPPDAFGPPDFEGEFRGRGPGMRRPPPGMHGHGRGDHPPGPPPPGRGGGPGGPPGGIPLEILMSQTKKTVERIVDILTPIQKKQWEALIGEPFPKVAPK